MNKKITVKTERGLSLCVLSDKKSFNEQLMFLFGFAKGHGTWAGSEDSCVKVEDHFVSETVSSFPILSVKDTDEPVFRKWSTILVAPDGGLPS